MFSSSFINVFLKNQFYVFLLFSVSFNQFRLFYLIISLLLDFSFFISILYTFIVPLYSTVCIYGLIVCKLLLWRRKENTETTAQQQQQK